MDKNEQQPVNPNDLPQKKGFQRKEVYQHPQPAAQGKPLADSNEKKTTAGDKDAEKTSKVEGLNEEKSEGTAGAFEGYEDQR